MKNFCQTCFIFLFVLSFGIASDAQNPERFQQEVDGLLARSHPVDNNNLILFTGSSSIRMWKLKESFPKHNVLNMGFGGSEMSDLLYYVDRIVVPFRPEQIFIYEGDNDIGAGRTTEQILAAADSILEHIRKELPKVEVIFISPKPSLLRWNLKEKYEAYNKELKGWTSKRKRVKFADVWSPMLDDKGDVQRDIFIKDGLHLNEKGYAIWTATLQKYLMKARK